MLVPQDEVLIRHSLTHFETTGEFIDPLRFQSQLAPPHDAVRPNGGCFVALLNRFLRPVSATETTTPKPNKVTDRLNQASAALDSRASGLLEKAGALRATAKTLYANGDRKAATLMLRRAKAAEKQSEAAQAAQLSLEQQLDLLESASVQKSVSEALASAVKKSKRSTRGLLSKAESCVEDSAEMHDLNSDIQAVMGELGNQGGDAFDEDELERELAEMQGADATAPAANASPDSVFSNIHRYPNAPQVPQIQHAVQGKAVLVAGEASA